MGAIDESKIILSTGVTRGDNDFNHSIPDLLLIYRLNQFDNHICQGLNVLYLPVLFWFWIELFCV